MPIRPNTDEFAAKFRISGLSSNFALISVFVYPGIIVFTVIPLSPRCLARGSVIVFNAPLLKPYAMDPVKPSLTSADEMLIMRPSARSNGNVC